MSFLDLPDVVTNSYPSYVNFMLHACSLNPELLFSMFKPLSNTNS